MLPPEKMHGYVANRRHSARAQVQSTVLGVCLIAAVTASFAAHAVLASQIIEGSELALVGIIGVGLLIRNAAQARSALKEQIARAEAVVAQTQVIVAHSREATLVVDESGRIESLNAAAEKLFGGVAAKAVGQPLSALVPQFTPLREIHSFPCTTKATGQRDGCRLFPIELAWNEVKLKGRRQFCAFVRDLSQRESSESLFQHLGLAVAPATGGDFLRGALKQLALALGSERAFFVEILGEGTHSVATLTMSERGETRSAMAIDLRNSACAEVLGKGYRAFPEKVTAQFPEDAMLGDVRADSFAGAPVLDFRGRAIGVVGVLDAGRMADALIVETTLRIFASRTAAEIERKRFEDSLSAERERLTVTLRSIADGCIAIDNDGRIVTLNPVAEGLTGWSLQEAISRPVAEVLHLIDERTRRRCQHVLQRIVQQGTVEGQTASSLIVPREGEERRVETNCTPIRDRVGAKLGAIIVVRDITERQRVNEERERAEKLESLGVVAGGIAHDFNNILTAILGNVTLALGTPEMPAKISDHLAAARKAAQRAQDLAGQLLTFAKGGSPIKQPTDLGRLLTDTVRCSLAGSRTSSDLEIAEGLWPAEADPGQIAQVIANLAINADQAMPSGGNIVVAASNLDLPTGSVSLGLRAGRWIQFSIEDHGIGIPEQYLKKIFDPYFTTKPTGSGLGLAATYSIVKNHGGVIFVESQPEAGSTFYVYLPASEKELRKTEAQEKPVPAGTGRVLVLDDEEAICMLVTCALQPLGYEVTETQDGAVALEKYEAAMKEGRKYDLVISDLTMPGRMSGQEAIQRLLKLDSSVRAIVSSGYANDPVLSRFEEFGFSGMIAKPYEIDALGRKVAEIMETTANPRVIYHAFDQRLSASLGERRQAGE